MSTSQKFERTSYYTLMSTTFACITMLIAIMVLVGWQTQTEELRRPFGTRVAVNPLTAINFIVLTIGTLWSILQPGVAARRGLRLCSGLVWIIAVARIVELKTGVVFGWDTLLFHDQFSNQSSRESIVSMAPNTALNFLLLSTALPLSVMERAGAQIWANRLVALTLVLSTFSLSGYVFGVAEFYTISSAIPMAFFTALSFCCLSAAILLHNRHRGFMAELCSPLYGGIIARILLPATVIVPMLLGFARLWLQNEYPWSMEMSAAISAVSSMTVLIALLGIVTMRTNRADARGSAARAALEKMTQELEDRVRQRTLELTRSEAKWRAIIEDTNDAIMLCDAFGKVLYQSSTADRMRGRRLVAGTTITISTDVHPGDVASVQETLRQCMLRPAEPLFLQYRLGQADGSFIRVEGTMHNMIGNAAVNAIVVNVRDVTTRVLMHEKLQENEELLTEMSSMAQIGGWEVLFPDQSVHWTDQVFHIHELRRDQMPDLDSAINFYAPEAIPVLRQAIDECIHHGTPWDLELPFVTAKGKAIWVRTLGKSEREGTELKRLFGVFQDITSRKNAELELQKNTEELRRSNAELEQFAYVASHDLQEPLRMVASYMQLLQRRYAAQLDKDANEFIDFAVDGAERMKVLVNDLLNFSRIGRSITMHRVDLNEVVTTVLSNLDSAIHEHHAVIQCDQLPEVRADRTLMLQLFQNLLSNALKFHHSDKPPIIHVRAVHREGDICVSVQDNGIGIEQEYLDQIFVVFKRLHDRSTYQGTGIGLAIAKKIVEQCGGSIWCQSTPDHGTTFFFTLPADVS